MNEEKKSKKKKGPRSRQERLEYALSLKRGKCLELLRPITECTPAELGFANVSAPASPSEIGDLTVEDLCERLNINISDLCYKLVNHTEGMRDVSDVKQVMVERDILGAVIPVRCTPAVSRVVTKSIGFEIG